MLVLTKDLTFSLDRFIARKYNDKVEFFHDNKPLIVVDLPYEEFLEKLMVEETETRSILDLTMYETVGYARRPRSLYEMMSTQGK